MAKQVFLNNFDWTFIGAVSATPSTGTPATELGYGILQISNAASSILSTLTGGDWYILTCFKLSGSVESSIEIIQVLGVNEAGYVSGGECRIRVNRAQEGTTAAAYAIGDHVSMRMTKGGAANFMQKGDALNGLTDPTTARTNLGLGTAAVTNTGTGSANTILGNDSRLTDSRAPTGAAGGVLGGTYPNPSFAVDMATQAELDAVAAAKEPVITSGTSSQYWKGNKVFTDFMTDVRATTLTAVSFATNAAITATDTVLSAFGKIQKQITDDIANLTAHIGSGGAVHANVVAAGAAGFMTGADKTKLDGLTSGAAVASVSGTAPVVSSGGTTPAISMAAATTSVPGYLTAADWNTFNGKQATLPAATTSVNGYLTSADWNTFNGKQAALVNTTNIRSVGGVSLLGAGDVGTLGVGFGGTGQTSFTNGQLLIGNTTGNTLTKASLTAGTGITITPGGGSITIASTAGAPTWTVKTANYTMVQGDAIMANTTGGAFTLTLPPSPAANDRIPLCDYGNTFQTNNLTVGANGNKIHGTVADMIFTSYFDGAFTYIDATQGWKITP